MHLHFNKLNFVALAVALLLCPLTLNAQSTKWSGLYVGVIGGAAAGNYNLHMTDGTDYEDFNSSLAGGRVGVQGGFDFNVKGLVLGAVADWSWSNAKVKLDESGSAFGPAVVTGPVANVTPKASVDTTASLEGTIKQMTTVRGRVGHRYGRVLPYVHGGLLVADTEIKESADSTSASDSSIHNGFVVGAGFEYFVAPHFSLNTEYAYNEVNGNLTDDVLGSSAPGVSVTENQHFSTVNVGFSYHF